MDVGISIFFFDITILQEINCAINQLTEFIDIYLYLILFLTFKLNISVGLYISLVKHFY